MQVTDLVPITPQGVQVTDLAWNTDLNLFVIGTDVRTGDFGVWEVQSDGSLWTPRGTSGLPGQPDAVTVTANSLAAVSIGGTLWRQTADSPEAGSWQPLLSGDSRGRRRSTSSSRPQSAVVIQTPSARSRGPRRAGWPACSPS